jgi:hypothetical protein
VLGNRYSSAYRLGQDGGKRFAIGFLVTESNWRGFAKAPAGPGARGNRLTNANPGAGAFGNRFAVVGRTLGDRCSQLENGFGEVRERCIRMPTRATVAGRRERSTPGEKTQPVRCAGSAGVLAALRKGKARAGGTPALPAKARRNQAAVPIAPRPVKGCRALRKSGTP